MAFPNLFLFFFVFHALLLNFSDANNCPKSFPCSELGLLEYPLTGLERPDCGLIGVACNTSVPMFKIGDKGPFYDVLDNISANKYFVRDVSLRYNLDRSSCFSFSSFPLYISPNISFVISPNLTVFTCDKPFYDRSVEEHFKDYKNYSQCSGFDVYYRNPEDGNPTSGADLPLRCRSIQMPVWNRSLNWSDGLFKLLAYEFDLEWHVEQTKDLVAGNKKKMKIIIAAAIPGAAFFMCLLAFLIWRNKKRVTNAYRLWRNVSSDPSSKSDIEGGSLYFGIPVFSYTELVEATNNFDSARELGDGGFGTVYYGKLRDGREVAIKRLYEHNYRRVEQFMNEIKILTCLKHPNLVSLYGCTSRRSRELLLVYEYVENGTVADHLHGKRADESPLTWSTRMNIAIETATALTYLHKSDIIHRDVKTNNILLDGNFCVKVADFGLSRLFPIDATHVSTAPQGTPGYVDPEYHQCYQLTGKSDVYSLGVVLVELISSMPAVDINRHRHEINLASFALNKIQKCDFEELIDSSLGYGTDAEVTRMTTSVADLAFRCLQPEKEMRPSMDEVLDYLKDIQNGDELMFENVKEENGNGKMLHSPETDEVILLKNKNLTSPVAVTDKWISSSSTIESSIE
ncbi:LEAF RUST 10 DISEASE-RESISTANCEUS RECEPTOR-LIKE PROTEIN KINASE-like 1.1 isoform X3 [Primulina eburnea]|uniref:LEAF RUST 10 DISEASE-RESISTANCEUS RECEPTOR-LIKE PROTEIN KINASE-like 1.1 isoform X3 n=1 Tax=Primulina eburnea TaxID=1245227 RepID=UPI003C6C9BDE